MSATNREGGTPNAERKNPPLAISADAKQQELDVNRRLNGTGGPARARRFLIVVVMPQAVRVNYKLGKRIEAEALAAYEAWAAQRGGGR